jgi:hypothetical protein
MDIFLKRLIWIEFGLDRGLNYLSNHILRWEGDTPNILNFKIDNCRSAEINAAA